MNTKPVAKSLHTITVIGQVARDIRSREGCDNTTAVSRALELLALAGRADPYGLAAATLKQLEA